MRLLLIEDDEKIAFFVRKGLKEHGFAVDYVDNGEDGLHMGLNEPYDVIIVDLMLPRIDGLAIIKSMRDQGNNIPMLIISAKRTVDERVEGLMSGGDDYLVKPFAFSELLARVLALLRRSTAAASPTILKVNNLSLNINTRKVRRAGKEIKLQPLEYSLLEYLMRHEGQIVSKTMIMEHVWDYNFNPRTNVVEARICCLRDKIDNGYDTKLIHTIRGVGYVLQED